MARIRSIKPEFFTDEEIAQLPPLFRLAYEGLWCQADKAGRLEDRPARLKVQILPYDDVDFGDVIRALATARFVIRYTGPDGRAYLQIRSFEKHQRPRPDEPDSQIPEPQRDRDSVTGSLLPSDDAVAPQCLGKEGKGKEVERKGTEIVLRAVNGSEPPVALEFPVVGKGGPTWNLTADQVTAWAPLYPSLDVLDECRHALAWSLANPGRRKTSSGMLRFLVTWLTRSNDRGGRSEGPRATDESRRKLGPSYAWECPHVEPCGAPGTCHTMSKLGRPVRAQVAS